jgi:hypothetical protein
LGAFYTNLGLGFRIRLGNRFEVFAQSDFLYTFTDYLDDVSGKYRTFYENDFQAYASKPGTNIVDPQNPYRGNPNNANDWIIYHGVGIKYNLGVSKKTFSAPRLSTYYPEYGTSSIVDPVENPKPSPDSIPQERQANTYNYTYNIQLVETEKIDSLKYITQILAWDQEIQKRENKIIKGQVRNNSLLELRRNFDEQNEKLIADEFLGTEEKEKMIQASQKSRFDLRYSIDSIGRRDKELKMEIDSIARLKSDYRLEQRILVVPDLDSLRFKQGTGISDSTKKQETVTSQTIEKKKQKTLIHNPEQAQIQEFQPSSRTETGRMSQQPESLTNLEQENRYLRSERDRLLVEKSQQQRPQNTRMQRTTTTNKQTTIREESPRDDGENRRRWWWPFAAAGAAAATVAILNNDDEDNEPIIKDSTAQVEVATIETIPFDQKELDNLSLAITSTIIGTPIITEITDQKKLQISSPDTLDPVINDVIVRDTIYVESDPIVTIFKI